MMDGWMDGWIDGWVMDERWMSDRWIWTMDATVQQIEVKQCSNAAMRQCNNATMQCSKAAGGGGGARSTILRAR